MFVCFEAEPSLCQRPVLFSLLASCSNSCCLNHRKMKEQEVNAGFISSLSSVVLGVVIPTDDSAHDSSQLEAIEYHCWCVWME